MVKLRLMRMGKTKQPTYRVVAADSRSPRNGRFIEIVGTYQPRLDPSVINIDNDKAVRWLKDGAQPTERVEKLLKVSGAWDQFKGLVEGASAGAAPVARSEPEPEPATDESNESDEATADEAGMAETDEGAEA